MALGLFIMIATLAGAVIGIYVILMQEKKKHGKKHIVAKNNINSKMKTYRFLNNNFITRGTFRKVVEQVAGLSVYNFTEVRIQAVKIYTRTFFASVALAIAGAFLFQDVIAFLLVCLLSVVLYKALVVKNINDVHSKVIYQFAYTLSSISEHYTRLGNIPDALAECKKGMYVQRAIDRIHLIITSNDAEEKLEEFYQTVPFQMLQTFAGVCYLLNDVGDEGTTSGTSAFKQSVQMLENEAKQEIRKLKQQKLMFQGLEWLPLAPLPFMGMIESFFISYIPGTAYIYNGMVGYIVQVIVILGSLLGYYFITTVVSNPSVRHADRSEIIDKLLINKHFAKFVNNVAPKKAKTRKKLEKSLNGALSQKDIPYIYASKVITASLCFIVSLASITLFTYVGKEFIYSNLASVSLLGDTPMKVEEQEKLRQIDEAYLARSETMRERDLREMIKGYFPNMTEMDVQSQVSRLNTKYEQYHSMHFYWWYVLIAFGISVIGWVGPDVMLALRKKLIATEAEEDVLQMQTMLAILMHTQLDTLEALWWLAKHSRVHKDAIMYAYHEYPSDPELALNRLKGKSAIPEFQQIVERLLSTIHQISLADAFSNLISDRTHMLSIREMVQLEALKKKRRLASPFAKAPLFLMAIGQVLVPIGILGITEFMNVFSQLSG